MQPDDALKIIRESLGKAVEEPAEIDIDSDLIEDDILDSLDGMVFMMEVENASGKKLPEDIDLVEEGYYKVAKLVEFLTA